MSSDPSARTYGRRAEALAKEDMLRRVLLKTLEGPRLQSRGGSTCNSSNSI